jgi:hypothetical protein
MARRVLFPSRSAPIEPARKEKDVRTAIRLAFVVLVLVLALAGAIARADPGAADAPATALSSWSGEIPIGTPPVRVTSAPAPQPLASWLGQIPGRSRDDGGRADAKPPARGASQFLASWTGVIEVI